MGLSIAQCKVLVRLTHLDAFRYDRYIAAVALLQKSNGGTHFLWIRKS